MSITNLTVAQARALSPSYSPQYSDSLEIKTSTISGAGNGCFAKTNITNGATIGTYAGYTHDHLNYEFTRRGKLYWSYYVMTVIERDGNGIKTKYFTINGLYGGNELRYINGCKNEPSIDPNVEFNNDGEAYAIKPILLGDELFMDY